MALTIVTGSDNAGYGHKSALKELLEQDPRVEKVIDEIGRASCRERV